MAAMRTIHEYQAMVFALSSLLALALSTASAADLATAAVGPGPALVATANSTTSTISGFFPSSKQQLTIVDLKHLQTEDELRAAIQELTIRLNDIEAGATGGRGPPGGTGPTGTKGDTGSQGPTGAMGDTGIQGLMGSKGDAGGPGPTGAQGDTGAQGSDGAQGNAGAAGAPGAAGANGATGASGANGLAATGPTGATGLAVTGPTGATGVAVTGPTGATGSTGANGCCATCATLTSNGTQYCYDLFTPYDVSNRTFFLENPTVNCGTGNDFPTRNPATPVCVNTEVANEITQACTEAGGRLYRVQPANTCFSLTTSRAFPIPGPNNGINMETSELFCQLNRALFPDVDCSTVNCLSPLSCGDTYSTGACDADCTNFSFGAVCRTFQPGFLVCLPPGQPIPNGANPGSRS